MCPSVRQEDWFRASHVQDDEQAKYGALEDYVEQHNLRVLALEPPPPAAGDYTLPFLHAPAL